MLVVVIPICGYRILRGLTHVPKKRVNNDAVFLLTVFVELIFAVAVGVVLAQIIYYADSCKGKKKFAIKLYISTMRNLSRLSDRYFLLIARVL